MSNLVIAIIGIAFSVALMTAGVSFLSPNIAIVATDSGSLDNEVTGLLADYKNLRTNVQHTPTASDYKTVYGVRSLNSLYSYNDGGVVTRASILPGTGAGWSFNQSCGIDSHTPCFCLKVTPGSSVASNTTIYRSTLVAAKKVARGSTSQVAFNQGGCSTTGALQYGSWPDPVTALPTLPYTLVVSTTNLPPSSCTCTQAGNTYGCGANWTSPVTKIQACNADPNQPTPPWITGEETQISEQPYSCVAQGNGNGKIVADTLISGPWNISQCAAAKVCTQVAPTGGTLSGYPKCKPVCPGTLSYNASSNTCDCPAVSSVSWVIPAPHCSGSVIETVSGSSTFVNSVPKGGYSGRETATCTTSGFVYSDQICTPVLNSCEATTNTYYNCRFNLAALPSGQSETLTNTTTGYEGYETATCNNGSWSYSNQDCYPECCVTTANTYGNCKFAVMTVLSGNSEPLSTTTPGYSGSETAICNRGNWSYSNEDCTAFQSTPAKCNSFDATPAPGPTVSLCALGVASTVSQDGPNWTWACSDPIGNSMIQCYSPATLPGLCGNDNGGTFAGQPWTLNDSACVYGSQYAINHTNVPPGGIAWQCMGPNNGALSGECNACLTGYSWNGSSCIADTCAASESVSWGQAAPSGECSASLPQGNVGDAPALVSTANGFSGSEIATCQSGGIWTFSSQTCSAGLK